MDYVIIDFYSNNKVERIIPKFLSTVTPLVVWSLRQTLRMKTKQMDRERRQMRSETFMNIGLGFLQRWF